MVDFDKLFPVVIRPVAPFRNVLKAFNENSHFGEIWKCTNSAMINVIIVGAGGTGGYVAAEIMRYVANLPREIQERIYITVCDGDTFEEKNLTRQLCNIEDLGENKAVALVNNYSVIFNNLQNHVFAYPEYIKNPAQLINLTYGVGFINGNIAYQYNPRLESLYTSYKTSDDFSFSNVSLLSDFDKHFEVDRVSKKIAPGHKLSTAGHINFHYNSDNDYGSMNDDDDGEVNIEIGNTSYKYVFNSTNYYTIPIIIDCVD